jgi:hypothetical protein
MWKRFFRVAFCAGAIAALQPSGVAQASAPQVEVYAGVTKLYGDVSGNEFDDGGGEVSATGYFNRVVGVEADFARFVFNAPLVPVFANHESALFGPHFAWHGNSRISPFGHVLLGVTRGDTSGPNYTVIGRSAFTLGLGGGVDVKVWRFLWLRPIQIDYLREPFPAVPVSLTGVPPPLRPLFGSYLQNNLRLSAGVVVRFGSLRRARKDW